MKRTVTKLFLIMAMAISWTGNAQTLVAKWTFPTGTPADSLADGGIQANLSKAVRTDGGTSAIDFSKNGLTTKAAQATGWDNGAMTKSWIIEITTLNYDNLKISSKQQSGGNNPGPQDYIIQYRIAAGGVWTDVPNTVILTANNWTSGVIDSVPLPGTCANQPSLWLRWLMTSNNNTAGGTVASTGIDKIDDIYITGHQGSTGISGENNAVFTVFPNPVRGEFRISSNEAMEEISVISQQGVCVKNQIISDDQQCLINTANLATGIYLVKIRLKTSKIATQKIVIN